jgi:hypothetical protein
MVGYYLRMHRAGVFLDVRLLLIDLEMLVMGVLGDHYTTGRQHKRAYDYNCNVFSHFVWL